MLYYPKPEAKKSGPESVAPICRIAYFSDAFHETNGVATIAREFEHFANRHRIPLVSVHGGASQSIITDGVVTRIELPRSPLAIPIDRELRCDLLFTRHRRTVTARLKSLGAELVHITGPGDVGILGCWVAAELHLPLVASWHTNLQEYAEKRLSNTLTWMPGRWRGKISAAAGRRSLDALVRYYRQARVVMAPNQEMVGLLESRTAKPGALMPHGVDAALFHPQRRNRRDQAFVLGYVGRLTPEKNVAALVEIERALLDRGGRDFRLVLVGAGGEESWLRANLRHAEFRGTLRGVELARAFADMDVFLFPSKTDTFGLAVLEAMASGVPVIVAPAGGPQCQVEPGETGFVAATPAEFADLILELQSNPLRHARMRRAARQHASSATWDKVFSRVYETYAKVLHRPLLSWNGI